MERKYLKDLAKVAIVAALYIALTLALYPLSYGALQFRISECLVLLTFFNRKYGYGVTLGVFIANFFNPEFAIVDAIFGTLSTLIAVILIIFFGKKLFIASLFPTLTSIIVVLEIYYFVQLDFFIIMAQVMGSMFIIESIIGYIIFKMLSKNKGFLRVIDCEKEDLLNEIQDSGVDK